ncbi:MAG TPA: CheR family methyltransferase [Haliangium sp.]|nr:CheR family methyltransferase [Haliangium sp.]
MLELSPPVFAILSALIEEKTGLYYGLSERDLLADKLSARAQEAGFSSLLDYYYFLRYDPASDTELVALIDVLVVGETYFFREYAPLRVLVDDFLEPWCRSGRRPRVWSAACATGEEPLTLAMMLAERGLLTLVDIVATDISQRALDRARAGTFGARALRAIPEPRLSERYLVPTGQGYTADPALVARISWRRINLIDASATTELGVFDAVLCRNVLIYFRDETIRIVVERLASALKPQGVLLVGVAESLLRFGTTFFGEERRGAFVYRKQSQP